MDLLEINKAFEDLVNRPGIYHTLRIPKNNVAQYRWKLKRGINISYDKKIFILQRAGYRINAKEFTAEDMVDVLRFALKNSEAARQLGPEYLLEKWRTRNHDDKG